MAQDLHIIGGGMAGSEAAWQAAEAGVSVVLHEMRPKVGTFAHRTGSLAEMVCSNSFRSDDDEANAVGLLHWEMRAAGGLIMAQADAHSLPAGGALAVDRDPFAEAVTAKIRAHPRIRVVEDEIRALPEGPAIIATGPLTSGALPEAIAAETPWIAEVRGKGLMQAFETVNPGGIEPSSQHAVETLEAAKDNNLLIGKGGLHGNVIRMAPMLNVTADEIDEGLEALSAAIRAVA